MAIIFPSHCRNVTSGALQGNSNRKAQQLQAADTLRRSTSPTLSPQTR